MTVYEPPSPSQPASQEKPSTQAITALVVSILAFVTCCGVILSPVGWYLGSQELRAIAAGQSPAAGETIARVAKVLGIVGTLCLAFLLLWIFAMGGFVVISAWLNQAMR
jgi:hypothetical protein